MVFIIALQFYAAMAKFIALCTLAAFLLSLLHAHAASVGDSHTLSTAETAETWCVPNPSLTYKNLQEIETFACNYVDCSSIHSGGPCFNPLNAFSHAAFGMNAYYQEQHQCFGNSGLISITDPSYGNCHFADSSCYFNSTGMNVIKDPSSGSCVYNVAVPASLRTKKGKSKASATFIGLMMLCLIIGCVLLAGFVYLILKLRQTPTTAAAVETPMDRVQEPTAAALP